MIIYLFCESEHKVNLNHIYQILSNHNRETLSIDIMDEFLLNFDCITTPIADKESYSYDDFLNDPNLKIECGFTTPLGYNHMHYLGLHEYLCRGLLLQANMQEINRVAW